MSFLECIFESFQKGIARFSGDIPYEIQSFCIGSGSSFNVYLNISVKRADSIYKAMISRLDLGKKVDSKCVGGFLFEKYHSLVSNSGFTYCFMFPLSKVEYFNPNDVLDEYLDTLKKQQKFKDDFLKLLKEKK